jgi:hypothetical protein
MKTIDEARVTRGPVDPWETSLGRGVKSFLKLPFGLVIVLGALKLYDTTDCKSKQEKMTEDQWRMEHGYSPQQLAANEHFNKCAQYRRTPLSVWSERQKYYALLGEGCYSDDRDDPRYPEATYPWNDYKPWQSQN